MVLYWRLWQLQFSLPTKKYVLRCMILVTGGTGLVGSHLLVALTKAGHRVRAIHRSESSFDAVKKVFSYDPQGHKLYQQIEWHEANLLDIPRLNDAFKDITVVYHCAAYISFDPKKDALLRKTNITGTANIVNLSLSHKVNKLCYVSSIATLGQADDQGKIDEENDWNPEENHNVYSIAKYGAELEVWRASQEGLKTVIVNPGVILGEGHWESASGIIFSLAHKGIPFITKGNIAVIDVLDVVDAMVALTASQISNQRFTLVGHNCSYKHFLELLCGALDRKPPSPYIAKFWLLSLSKLDRLSNLLFRTKRKLFKETVKSMYSKDHYDSSSIQTTIHFTFRPLEESINRICNCFLNDRS